MFDNDPARDFIVRGIAAAKADQRQEARRLLERALRAEPTLRDRIRAWQYLSEMSETVEEKRSFLEKILVADPTDGSARRALATLDGRLDPREMIDPNTRSDTGHAPPTNLEARGFVCAQCGSARAVFDPQQQCVVCEHCRHPSPADARAVDEDNDFVAALWTARGHRVPSSTDVFSCNGCGATFLPGPAALSTNCPYCGSVYVAQPAPRDLIQPDGMIAFAVAQSDAQAAVGPEYTVRGVYLPVWLFTFAGEATWQATRTDSGWSSDRRREEVSGSFPLIDLRTLVPATDRLSIGSHRFETIEGFDLSGLTAYQSSLLAGWPAETYQASLEEAAKRARTAALPTLRAEVRDYIDDVENLRVSTARVAIDSFKLVLLPFWLAYPASGSQIGGFVNGQTGSVHIENQRSPLAKWITGFFAGDE